MECDRQLRLEHSYLLGDTDDNHCGMSDMDETQDDVGGGNGDTVDVNIADREPDLEMAASNASVAGDSVAGTSTIAPANPRKRKKSSRASVYLSSSPSTYILCQMACFTLTPETDSTCQSLSYK